MPAMSLNDLDELSLNCRTEEARNYVSEAIACYKAGAFRSCIVAAWIAVVYDLIAKIRELALGGDAEAQRIVTELGSLQPRLERGDEAAIRRILEIERDIVDIANDKFGFFEGTQVLDLKRLQDDRNRCAHPTFQGTDLPYSPTAELSRTHLVHAVRHVLSQPPVLGKAATSHIVRLVESELFPIDVDLAKIQLKAGGLDRPKDSLVRSVVDHLVFGLVEGDAKLKGRRQTAVAIRAMYDLFPGLCEPRIQRALNTICRRAPDRDLRIVIGLHRHLPQTWGFLEQDNRNKLAEFIRQSSTAVAKLVLPTALTIMDLAAPCQKRIGALESEDLGQIAQQVKHPIVLERATALYCESKNWDMANSRYQHVIEPVLNDLNEAQLRRILVAPTKEGADLDGAHSFRNFLTYIYKNEKLPRAEIIQTLRDQRMDHYVQRLEMADTEDESDEP
jgi:hypothetical protein